MAHSQRSPSIALDGVARQNYRRFVIGMVAGDFAYQIQGVAIAWQIFLLHHSPFDLGLVGLTLFLPALLFVIPAGLCADVFKRSTIIFWTQMVEAISSLLLVATIVAHVKLLPIYLALLAIIGTARAFGAPAERTLLPLIVGSERYLQVQAQYSALSKTSRVLGPAIGGIGVAWSVPAAILISAILAAGSGIIMRGLQLLREGSANRDEARTWRGAFQGLHFILARPVIAGAITLDLFAVLFGSATALLPAFADGVFHVGPIGLGLLRTAPAFGAVVTGIVLSRYPIRRRIGPILLYAVTGYGLATIVFGLSHVFALSLCALVFVGATDTISVLIRNGLVQLAVPDEMRGRVTAFENIFIGASNEIGEFESGLLAGYIGVVPAVLLGGVGTLLVIAGWSFAFPALRRADTFGVAGKNAP